MASGLSGPEANLTTGTYPDEKHFNNDLEKASLDKQGNVTAKLEVFEELVAAEADHQIQYRTLSWQQTALLLFGEYVCLAILALAWSWSVLGWVGGFIVTTGLGVMTWYTSYVLWEFVMAHPEVRDICDIGYILFGNSRVAYEITAAFLLLNNIMLMGFHVFTGSKILNTLSDHSQCTTIFTLVTALISIIVSLPRTLHHVAQMSIVSALSMGVALLLTWVYSGIQDHPTFGYGGDWPTLGPVRTSAGAPETTFVNGMNAALNITFLWIGQILYPSFIAEMKRPQDFPKALAALTAMQFVLFLVASIIGYYYFGQYATAPIIGSLTEPWAKKSAFAFVLLPTVIIGAIYSNVASKYLYKRILGNSRHAHSHTVIGWGVWVAIVVFIWALAFVFGDVIPSMGDFLGILSALFDSFFGFIFWALAYFQLRRRRLFKGAFNTTMTLVNVFIFLVGLFMLTAGMYTSVDAIVTDYSGTTRKVFGCVNNAL